jgi:diguanylate cyclase (GGDEF)-like protein/PAS domain S-box-containing protein
MTALLIGAITITSVVREMVDWRQETVRQLDTQAQIVAANTAPALLFGDARSATETLGALQAARTVVHAGVYDTTGRLFASYGDSRYAASAVPTGTARQVRLTPSAVTLSEPIVFQGQRLGAIHMTANLRDMYVDLATDMALNVIISLMAFAASTLLLVRVQRSIVSPMEELTAVMQKVTASNDYTARATPKTHDEIGVLARAFNNMLDAVRDRDAKLAQHQAQLEDTVRQRTSELATELAERKAAQEALRAHDAMLKSVALSAAELLGSLNLEDATASVLELIGRTLAVGRVQLCGISTGSDGHLRASVQQEWCAPGVTRLRDDPALRDLDLTALMPALAASSLVGDRTTLLLEDIPEAIRGPFERAEARSILFIPVMSEGRLSGGLWFVDSAPTPRPWNWAETDTLATLAGLIGVSEARARYVKELADANTIVQNSPTVLYRLKGEPQLTLTYVSHNVTKFGYDPRKLVKDQDFLKTVVHPDDQARLTEAMAGLLERNVGASTVEFRLVLPHGGFRWVENRFTAVRDDAGRLVELEGILIDITERKAAEEKIALLARTDSLTGLANRATFVERLHQVHAAAKRGGHPFAVLYLDLDHFKDINDTRGHPVGDLLLKEVAERLKSRARESDVVARLGGDEFAILQTDIADPADAGALGADIIESLGQPYHLDGADLHVTASVGISPFTGGAASPDTMLAQADLALYRAKEDGRNQYRFHSEDLDHQVSERVAIATDLRDAIKRSELYLEYQPQVELLSGRIVGMEALVRWRHPTRGVLQPRDFLPIAEGTGVIDDVGRWVLDSACRQMAAWREAGVAPPVIAVNVSMNQLKRGQEFIQELLALLKSYGIQPGELELDVTESMLAKVTLAQNDVLDRLADAGVRLALDDFGTEYSTFDYLRAYRVHHLKVARQFIESAAHDSTQAATVRAIIGAARELGIKVIAEGVETQEQRSLLLSIGRTTKGQGFYFSEPVRPDRATELLRQGAIVRNGDHAEVPPGAAEPAPPAAPDPKAPKPRKVKDAG